MDGFDFLAGCCFRAEWSRTSTAIRDQLADRIARGLYSIFERALDLRWLFDGSRPSEAPPTRVIVFEPSSAPGTSVMLTNQSDGWMTLCNVLSMQLPGEHVQFRSAVNTEFPVNDFELFSDAETLRYVRAFRDDPKWEFYAMGERQWFEDETHYRKPRIADRLTRSILVEYLRKLGWDVETSTFWSTQRSALYIQESERAC